MLKRLLLLFLLVQGGCSPYLVVSGGAVNRDKLGEIEAGVARHRGLEFKGEVSIEVKNKEEMLRYLERDLEQEYGQGRLQKLALAYAKLGLYPKDLDLKKALLGFYSEQLTAFYDYKTKRLVLPESMGGGMVLNTLQFLSRRDLLGEAVLAHELTHVLQDQHFSLQKRLGPSNNDDKTLALRAVIEGDATLSGFVYLLGGTDGQSLALVTEKIREGLKEARSDLSDVPGAVVEEMLFQYYGGVSFVSRLLKERDWRAVDRLYAAPPLSTEQVLHPEKYLDAPDFPTRIELPALASLFGPGWEEIENNVLGELMTEVLFRSFFTEAEAQAAAEGWDGDRFVAFRRGEEIAFIWATLWDSSTDAEEFWQKYRELLAKKSGPEISASAYIERRDRRVIVVEGLERARVGEKINEIWQGMRLEEERP